MKTPFASMFEVVLACAGLAALMILINRPMLPWLDMDNLLYGKAAPAIRRQRLKLIDGGKE